MIQWWYPPSKIAHTCRTFIVLWAFCQDSSQGKPPGLPIHLHDAWWWLQHQEKSHNESHWAPTSIGRDVACDGPSARRQHQNARHKPTGGMVLYDLHKTDRAEYVQSGQKLPNETLQTLAKKFQLIHKTCQNKGILQRHQVGKICAEARRKIRQELEEQYARKLHHFTNQRRSIRLHVGHNNSYHHQHDGWYKYPKLCDGDGRNNNKQDNKKGTPIDCTI